MDNITYSRFSREDLEVTSDDGLIKALLGSLACSCGWGAPSVKQQRLEGQSDAMTGLLLLSLAISGGLIS